MNTYSGIVYKILNPINGKIYIGQTIQRLKERKKDHRGLQDRLKHLVLYRALRKYGFDSFEWEIIHYAKDKSELDKMEEYYINHYKTMNPEHGYNLTYGGEGGLHPPEIRKRISDSLRGRVFSEKTRNKLSNSLKGKYTGEDSSWWGRKHTDEEKKKISNAQKGNKNHNFGKKASDYTMQKMSEAKKGDKSWNHKRVMCVETQKIYMSSKEAFEKIGIDNSSIGKCCKGKRPKAGGYTWKYVD